MKPFAKLYPRQTFPLYGTTRIEPKQPKQVSLTTDSDANVVAAANLLK